MHKISVIIPTLRPGIYLEECLNSLYLQSLSLEKFEVIIVLNGEKLPYEENIKAFFCSRPRLDYNLIYYERPGVSVARNLGIEAALSDNLLFLDDDDFLSPTFLENLLIRSGYEVVVATRFLSFASSINESAEDYVGRVYRRCQEYPNFDIFRFRGLLSSACGKLIPRDVIGNARFDPRFKRGEDSLFMFAISKNIKQIVLADPAAIYYRRERSGSARNAKTPCHVLLAEDVLRLVAYSKFYLSDLRRYNFRFFLSRIIATGKKYFG